MLVYYEGMIGSITVLDDLGSVVAAWPKPLRYWQGDRPVFKETYLQGRGGEFVADVSQEWVTGSWSSILQDPHLRGQRIGTVAIAIDLVRHLVDQPEIALPPLGERLAATGVAGRRDSGGAEDRGEGFTAYPPRVRRLSCRWRIAQDSRWDFGHRRRCHR
jgi:hypothetical protein